MLHILFKYSMAAGKAASASNSGARPYYGKRKPSGSCEKRGWYSRYKKLEALNCRIS